LTVCTFGICTRKMLMKLTPERQRLEFLREVGP